MNSVKATANTLIRGKAVVVIAIFSVLALFSIGMAIYDIIDGNLLFGVLFALAAIGFITLLLLKINSVFGTYIKAKNGTLYMKSWSNSFLPYDSDGGLFSDLKPAKTKLTEVSADELSLILIGTKEFIKRNATSAGKKLTRALYPYEHSSKKSRKRAVSMMDLFYIETVDGECAFMCIYGYDAAAVVDVIGSLYELNPQIHVKAGGREYHTLLMNLKNKA